MVTVMIRNNSGDLLDNKYDILIVHATVASKLFQSLIVSGVTICLTTLCQ